MTRQLISEQTVVQAAKSGQKTIVASTDAIITHSAKDKASALGVRFVQRAPESKTGGSTQLHRSGGSETIAIGSDHGGFQLKAELLPYLEGLGYTVVDVGTYTEEPCDYPEFAYMVARMVSLGQASRGIVIDAVGSASAMVANKLPGVRAACCHSEFVARSSREHNDANVLSLGGRVLGTEAAKSILKTWLETWFGGGRHKGRIDKITQIERQYQKG